MDLQSLLRLGSLTVNMLGTPQFRNMAKFVVPYLAPQPPAVPETPADTKSGGQPAAGNSKSSLMGMAAPGHGIPGAAPRPYTPLRRGGLEALQGLMGNQSHPWYGQPVHPDPMSGIPIKSILRYATPENAQKMMQWGGVMKQFMGMFGGSAGTGGQAATTASAKKPPSSAVSASMTKKATNLTRHKQPVQLSARPARQSSAKATAKTKKKRISR